MWQKFPLIVLVVVWLLSACSQGGESKANALTPTAKATAETPVPQDPTELPPTATEIPPTEAPLPPTEVPSSPTPIPATEMPPSPTPIPPTITPTEEPTTVLEEVISNQAQDIVGTWDSQNGHQLIVTGSGGVRIKDLEQKQEIAGVGTYRFEGDQLVLDSQICQKWESGFVIEFPCLGTYSVYVVKEGDKIVGVRFEETEDPFRDRRLVMAGQTWQRAEE